MLDHAPQTKGDVVRVDRRHAVGVLGQRLKDLRVAHGRASSREQFRCREVCGGRTGSQTTDVDRVKADVVRVGQPEQLLEAILEVDFQAHELFGARRCARRCRTGHRPAELIGTGSAWTGRHAHLLPDRNVAAAGQAVQVADVDAALPIVPALGEQDDVRAVLPERAHVRDERLQAREEHVLAEALEDFREATAAVAAGGQPGLGRVSRPDGGVLESPFPVAFDLGGDGVERLRELEIADECFGRHDGHDIRRTDRFAEHLHQRPADLV